MTVFILLWIYYFLDNLEALAALGLEELEQKFRGMVR